MSKSANAAVFKDTEQQCKTNPRLRQSIAEATAKQKIYRQDDPLPAPDPARFPNPAKLTITKNRTLQAAKKYRGSKVAVLNFANPRYPGGSVASGSAAQEEALCRCSDLYFSLNTEQMKQGFYEPHRQNYNPLNTDDLIYTPKVTVFKSDTAKPELLPEKDWQQVDVISCSAPHLGSLKPGAVSKSQVSDEALLALHEKRLRRILDAAAHNGAETVVLGAFGCGVYNNPPELVARAFQNVLKDYTHVFQNIEIAVYCTKKDERNFNAFADAFQEELDAGTATVVRDPGQEGRAAPSIPTREETELDFACAAKLQKALLDRFAERLEGWRQQLEQRGKKSPGKSFAEDVKRSSGSYQKMTACLDNTMTLLKDRTAGYQELRKSIYALYMSGLNYYNDHVGVLGPIRDYGGARFGVAEEITKLLPGLFNAYTHLHGSLSALKDETGRAWGDKSPSAIEEKAAALAEGMSAPRREKLDGYLKPYSVKDLLMSSQKQIEFRKKVRKLSKTFALDYDYTKQPDAYLKLKPNMSVADKAKYYLLKELYDQVYRPDAQYEEICAVVSGFNAAQFTQSVGRLAANPAFQRCVRLNPDTAFTVWKQTQSLQAAPAAPQPEEALPVLR